MQVEGELRDTLDESRKRFMIRLPKYRWDTVHDIIVRTLMTNREILKTTQLMVGKVYSIAHKALYVKKTLSKKATGTSYDISARIVTYCLICLHILESIEFRVPPNLATICNTYQEIVALFVNGDDLHIADKQQKIRRDASWQTMVDWGLRFLAAPVAIVDYAKAGALLIDQLVPLDKSLEITTLWRIMSNIMVSAIDAQGDELECPEQLDGENQYKNLMRDEPKFPLFDMVDERFNYVSETHMTELMISSMEQLDKIVGKRIDRIEKKSDHLVIEDYCHQDAAAGAGNIHPQIVENVVIRANDGEVGKWMSK